MYTKQRRGMIISITLMIILVASMVLGTGLLTYGFSIFEETVNNPPQLTIIKPTSQSVIFVFLVRTGFPETDLIPLYQKHASLSTSIVTQFAKGLLDSNVTNNILGQEATTYFSLADIQGNATKLHSLGYTWVAYDLEGSYSPPNEVLDPIGSVRQASQYAHNNGLKLMISPAGIPTSDYSSMAQYSDGWVLQAMDLISGDPTVMSNTIHANVAQIKSGNPNEIIILQDSVNVDTVDQMNNAWDLTKDVVNGITVFYSYPSQISEMASVLTYVDGIS